MTDAATLTALCGAVISTAAYTGSVLGDILGAWLRAKLYGDR